jgi:hypothetical protein
MVAAVQFCVVLFRELFRLPLSSRAELGRTGLKVFCDEVVLCCSFHEDLVTDHYKVL